MSRAKNPKYESMSLEELKANMEKSKKELEQAIHNKNILEQRKKLAERRERSHRLIVKGAEFEKADDIVMGFYFIEPIHISVIVVEGMGKRNPHQVASRQEPGKGLLCYIAKLALVILHNYIGFR